MRYLLLLTLPTLLAGCPINLDTQRYPTQQPEQSRLVGKYEPTPATRSFITGEGKYTTSEASIELREDGTFTMSNIPDWWQTDFGEPAGGFDSGIGTWKVAKHQEWWGLDLHFDSTVDFSSRTSGGGLWTQADLVGHQAAYDIVLVVGDPDMGDEMRFTRVDSDE